MLVARGRQHRRRERGDRQRQAEREDHDGGQHVGGVGGPVADAHHQRETHRRQEGPGGHRQPRPDALGEPAGPGREQQHHDGHRHEREAGLQGRVAEDGLELDRQEEDGAAEGGVDDERDQVGRRELRRREHLEGQHRVAAHALRHHEGDQRERAADQRGEHHRVVPAGARPLDQGVGDARQARRREHGAHRVEAGLGRIAGLGHVAQGHHDHGHRDRQVEQEDQPPRDGVDQVAAQQRADRDGDAAETRPRADGRAAVVAMERGLDDREASRREQRAPDPLQRAGGDQRLDARRERAQQRGDGEPDDADHEDAAPAEAVAERAAQQQQSREGQGVGVDRPLQAAEAGVEVVADRRASRRSRRSRRCRRSPTRGRWRTAPTARAPT